MVSRIPSCVLGPALEQKAIDQAVVRTNSLVWVYLIHWQDRGPTKVGVANEPITRRNDLQVGNPYLLRLYTAFGFTQRDQAFDVEQRVLKRLKARRMTGEWLDATPLQVRQIIERGVQQMGLSPTPWEAVPPPLTAVETLRAKAAMAEYDRLRA